MSMIVVNFLAFFDATPHFLKHARGNYITFADLVAPFFLFALGMMYRKSLLRRIAKTGRRQAYFQFAKRYLLILAIGIAGGCIGKMSLSLDWGILQAIGLAGLIALPFMEIRLPLRVLVAAALLLLHQLAILPYSHETMAISEQGGPISTLAWAALIMFASVAGDLLESGNISRSMKTVALSGFSALALGLTIVPFVPTSKVLVTASYIILTTGISAMLFALFIAAIDIAGLNIPFLRRLGRNALLIFLMHYALVKAAHRLMSSSTSLPLVLAGSAVIFLLCYVVAYILDRKRIYLKV